MRDFGLAWICETGADPSICPATGEGIPLVDCHEWDGLFSIHARDSLADIRLTGWCDGMETGTFELNRKNHHAVNGTTRVIHAPEIVEPDGYSFPPGAFFGAGLWAVECVPANDAAFVVKIQVRDWDSTD